MNLFIPQCLICRNKISLGLVAHTRNDLRARYGGNLFYCTCGTCNTKSLYNVAEVRAETDSNYTPGGAIVGGIVGLLGGPLGAILGTIVGGAIGGANDTEDLRKMNTFNSSI